MTLLFDENLPFRLARAVARIFPASCHVTDVGLGGASDQQIARFAAAAGYAVVTRDVAFAEFLRVRGWPPKTILVRQPQGFPDQLLARFEVRASEIRDFLVGDQALLVL